MLISRSELCARLSIEAKQLTTWLRGGLPSKGSGRERRFNESAVRAWMKAKGKPSPPETVVCVAAEGTSPEWAGEPIVHTWSEVAAHFGRAERTVATWINQGMPCRRGRPGTREGVFPLNSIRDWLEGRPTSGGTPEDATKNQAQTRLTLAKAEMAEIELREKRGQLVEADELWRRLTRLHHEAKAQLGQLPAQIVKCFGDKASPKLRNRIRQAVRRTVDEALMTLALSFDREAQDAESNPEPPAEDGNR